MKKIIMAIVFWLGLLMMAAFCVESFAAVDWSLKAPKALDSDETISKIESEGKAKQEAVIMRPKFEYKAQGLKDPFQPLVTEKPIESIVTASAPDIKPLPALTIQGLIWRGVFPQAIINNKVVKVGDSIEDAEVAAIEKEGVTILYANRRYKLSSPSVMGPRDEEQIKGGRNEGAY